MQLLSRMKVQGNKLSSSKSSFTNPPNLFTKYNQSIIFLPLHFDTNDGLYYTNSIQIGTPPQQFQKILFDPITVSQTWVLSTQCKQKPDTCATSHLQFGSFFDSSLSNTFTSACVPFLVTRKTFGEVSFDTLHLLQIDTPLISISKVKLGLAVTELSSTADAIISLRFPIPDSTPTFMETLTNQIPSISPSFSFFLSPNYPSYDSIVFGSLQFLPPWITSLLQSNSTKFFSLNSIAVKNSISWVMDMNSLSINSIGLIDTCKGEGGMLGEDKCHLQIDSSLPYAIAGPPTIMRQIGKSIPIDATCSQYNSFPTLLLNIQNQMYNLTKEMYVKKLPNGSCKLLMAAFAQDVDELFGRRYILGVPFLKSYFIGYDLNRLQISITKYL